MAVYSQQLMHEKLDEMRTIVTTITSSLVIPLYLIFWIPDLIYAPQYKWEFLLLRCLVIPIAFIVNSQIKKVKTLYGAQNVALAYVFALAAILNVMIIMLAVPTSIYYTGLVLIAIGALGFFPWSKKYFIYVVLVIFLPYIAIIYSMGPSKQELIGLIFIGFFINGVITILWVIRYYRENLRIKEITARLELKSEIEKRREAENDLIEARDVALQASKAKSTFLANMSHELRTPLNAIIGYSELLQESTGSDGNQEYIKDLKKIDAAGKTLLDLINGVLDISKIEAGQMTLSIEEFDLADMLHDVESVLQPLVDKNNNQLTIDYPANLGLMRTDETKLRQVLYNLGSNASKFTHNGDINLSVHVTTIEKQEWLRFDVRDTGIGMTSEQSEKVFNEFTQADSSTTRKFGGTGLGLSICKRFCIMLGGDIFVQSEKDVGSTFSVLIPRFINHVQDTVNLKELEKILQ